MKLSRSKSMFNIFTLFTLLALLVGMLPALPVQAETLASPLFASGDFAWAKGMGGADIEIGNDIVVDSSGNVYTTGKFHSTADFDPGPGTFNLTSTGFGDDIFVSKLDGNGSFLWAKSMGGMENDDSKSITVDLNGNVYTTGYFQYTADFDPGPGTANLTSAGNWDIFVSKLDSNGNFVWAKSMGGTNYDSAFSVAIDSNGNVYTTGYFVGTADFDPGPGIFNLTSAGSNFFVSKLDNNGNFVWAKGMGGMSNNLAVDSNGNVYTTGKFVGTVDFDPGVGTFNLTSAGGEDIFISKLDSNGNFVWAKGMGGTSAYDDRGYSITVDSSSNVYITGHFYGTADFDPGPGTFNLTSAGGEDIFISKLDSNGDFVWAKAMGGAGGDYGRGIALDSSSNVYTTGWFGGTTDFDPGPGTFNLTSAGSNDIFVSKLDSNGDFVWAKRMGGTTDDFGYGIALDASGNVYTTGRFSGTVDFDPGPGTFNLTSAGLWDIFVSKLQGVDAPTVTSIVRASANPTSAANVDFTVTFSKPVTGVDKVGPAFDDFSLTTNSGISGASVTNVSGSGTTYTVTVNTGSGNGTLRLNVGTGGNIVDAALNPLSVGFTTGEVYTVIKTATFADVPLDYWAWGFIERLYNAGITGGCSTTPLMYCPDIVVTRAQMAVFLLRGEHGSTYSPPAVGTGTGFSDVAPTYWAAAWIKQLALEGITFGCGPGVYCPETSVTRDQMAVFLLRAKYGSAYSPPPATGVFTDVPADYWAAAWIEQLAAEGITSGCGINAYCPNVAVTRAQMAVFLVRTFSLP